jgi:hypothetical protein
MVGRASPIKSIVFECLLIGGEQVSETCTGETIGARDCLSLIGITDKYMKGPVRNLASLAAIHHFGTTAGAFKCSLSFLLAPYTQGHDVE